MTSVMTQPSLVSGGLSNMTQSIAQPAQLQQQFIPRPPPNKSTASSSAYQGLDSLPTLTNNNGNASNSVTSTSSSIVTPPPAAKPPSRLPSGSSQRKLSLGNSNLTNNNGNGSLANQSSYEPTSPTTTGRILTFPPPSTPTPTPAGTIGLAMPSPQPMHSPSPFGSAYDEVRIPIEPPVMMITPAVLPTTTTLIQPLPTVPPAQPMMQERDPQQPQPSVSVPPVVLPSAHTIVPLPASFHYPPSSASTTAAVVNLPNILIPPSPSLPSPVLWSHVAAASSTTAESNNNQALPAPISPQAVHSAAPQFEIGGGSVSGTSSQPLSSNAPFSGLSSMDSRQWASLLLKYRAGDAPTPASRTGGTQPTTATASAATTNGTNSAATTAPSTATGTAAASPLYSPNVFLTSTGVARPPSARGKSRQGQRRPSVSEVDNEKEAMQNELHRLRAMIAMQTHAAASMQSPPQPTAAIPPSPSPLTIPQGSPMITATVHTTGSTNANAGAGLSWNTAFTALSNNFQQQQQYSLAASPSPAPISSQLSSPEPAFTALPSPAVTTSADSSNAMVDHRSTFRSMSMLIRSGSAAHTSATSVNANSMNNSLHSNINGTGHFPHPPNAGPLLRARSAEEPSQLLAAANNSSHHPTSTTPNPPNSNDIFPASGSPPKLVQTTSLTDASSAASLDEIEEDLAPQTLEEEYYEQSECGPITPQGPTRTLFGETYEDDVDGGGVDDEIEEESHLRSSPQQRPTQSSQPQLQETDEPATTSSAVSARGHASRSNIAASTATTSAASPVPLFLPPSTASRKFRPCNDPACAERQKKDRLELQRVYQEEMNVRNTKHQSQMKSMEQRFKRDLTQKDQRISQLEKLQHKLLQPHSKLVAQNEELLAYIKRLKDQLVGLGAVPVAQTSSQASGRDEQKFSSPISNGHASTSAEVSDLSLPNTIETDLVSQIDHGLPGHDSTVVIQEPFFNTSAPRTISTSKARNRSNSFSTQSQSAAASKKQHFQQFQDKPPVSSTNGPSQVDTANNGSNSPRTSYSTTSSIPTVNPSNGASSPLTLAPSVPSRPHAFRSGPDRPPRKNSLKTATTVTAITGFGSTGNNAGASSTAEPSLVGTPAPVTARPVPRQAQQSRGRAATIGSG